MDMTKVSVKGNPYSFVGLALATVHLKLVTFFYSRAISTTRPSRQPSQVTLTSPVGLPGSGRGICPPRPGHMTSNICPHHRCPHEPQDPQQDAFDDTSRDPHTPFMLSRAYWVDLVNWTKAIIRDQYFQTKVDMEHL